jgi:hypothetical protein
MPAALPPPATFLHVQEHYSTLYTTHSKENVTGEVNKSPTPAHHQKRVAQFLVHFCW